MSVGELLYLPEHIRQREIAGCNQDVRPKILELFRQVRARRHALKTARARQPVDSALEKKGISIILIGEQNSQHFCALTNLSHAVSVARTAERYVETKSPTQSRKIADAVDRRSARWQARWKDGA